MRDEFQALKATQQLNGAAPSSFVAAAVPTKESTAILMDTHSGAGTEGSGKCRHEPSSDEDTDVNSDDDEEASGPFELFEATGAFLEAAFKKLDNAQRKKKLAKFGTADSRSVRCPKLDPVVATNVGQEATRVHRSSSRLHQFLLDPVNPSYQR